ncbi:Glycosyl hydrolases family 18 [Saccharopolyspora kobensis]|uniref:Glycosyl hydrolases family 18 n=1 Tax=Saccharopolyspora kobensis TaxID=146035 RepID=A0A1H5U2Z5_9PSEU|nr:glycosyl hydrolase family 18 protein [Saccharopolyspora kobensis]SEF69492.1 Glycosyl hydrolases family 18 [Saccharopolyspora kobensis]SFC77795.1 Glycosyl hydrolases family 18 [Saccharopolyspora kobensis]
MRPVRRLADAVREHRDRRERFEVLPTGPGAAHRVRTFSRLGGSIWLLALIAVSILVVSFLVVPRGGGPVAQSPVVVASLPFWNLGNGTEMVVKHRESVNEVSPWIYGLDTDGGVLEQYPPEQTAEVGGRIAELRAAGIPIVPSLANITDGKWAYEPVAAVLHDPVRRHRHVTEIVELVEREDYAGIDIDYENLRAGDRQVFSDFVTELGAALDAVGKTLSVAVFAKETDAGYDERNVAQDYAAIGRAADQVRLMGYDFHWNTSPPGSVAPIDWIRSVLDYARTQVPPERIVLGVPLYGYDWVAGGEGTGVTWLKAFQLATEHGAQPQYDTRTQSPWFRYTDEQGRAHEVWFENAASSKAKFEAARGAGIGGVYLWMFGYEDTDTWHELARSLPVEK